MVAPVLVAVVGAAAGAVMNSSAQLLIKLGEKRYKESKEFSSDIESITRELRSIAAAKEDQLLAKGDPKKVKTESMEEMCDLACDIEDCLDRIHQSVAESDGKSVVRLGGPPYADEVKQLKRRLIEAHQRERDFNVDAPGPSAAAMPANTGRTKVQPVGMEEAKRELVELLMGEGQPEQPQLRLRVISIVGVVGSGKSTLAKAVYDSRDVDGRFPCRAWVVASEHGGGAEELPMALFKKLCPGEGDPATEDVHTKISKYLTEKRYLIVLDNIKDENCWNQIKSAFPKNATGTIIVTTTFRKVAQVSSRGNGYMFIMRALNNKNSEELLKAVLNEHSPSEIEHQISKSILNKCDGHPLALVTVANYLWREDVINNAVCDKLCHDLGFQMETQDAFKELREVLMKGFMNNYTRLKEEYLNLRTCLLYVCVFPNGYHIRRSRLMRRWFAEGYVQHNVADKYFNELVDWSVIWPTDTRKNVKTCKAHGIFHEFMLYMSSKSAKFITYIENSERGNYRHLFTHKTPLYPGQDSKSGDVKEELRAHSLTVCGSAADAVGCLPKCTLLRVLDLQECNDLKDEDLDCISELWHVRYLSLGATISRLPRHIEKLYCLETLDTKKTKKEIELPVEVIKLPHLAHLLGKFKLADVDWEKTVAGNFFKQDSNLQALAGSVTHGNDKPGFLKLIPHMKKSSKVKIWCDSISDNSGINFIALLSAIKAFIQSRVDTLYGDHSLSLYLRNSIDILSSLGKPEDNMIGYLSSLKLHGNLSGLTQFAKCLSGLKEVCLAPSTHGLTNEELQNFSMLPLLELQYLKLVNIDLTGFEIKQGHFPQLQHLYLVQCQSLPTISKEALPRLLSLWLLNQGLNGLSGIEIARHKLLQELALDSEVNTETITTWEIAAKKHPKKPKVLFFKRVGPNGTGSSVKYVPTERPAPETGSSVQQEQQINAVHPISVEDPNSAMEHANDVVPAVVSTKLPSATNDNARPASSQASILVEAQGLKSPSSSEETKVQDEVVEEAKSASQKNMSEISSNNSQNNRSGGLYGGPEHGTKKGSPGDVIKEPTVEGLKSGGKDTTIKDVKSGWKVNGKVVDEITEKTNGAQGGKHKSS